MADEQLIYPQAWIAEGNGDLVQVTDFSANLTDNSKQIHTLRRKGAGFSQGTEESTVSFNAALDEDGAERDWWRAVQKKQIKQLRAKLPGGRTLIFNGKVKSCNVTGPLDGAVMLAVEFIGKLDDQ